jgi:hypothetical protein
MNPSAMKVDFHQWQREAEVLDSALGGPKSSAAPIRRTR